MLDLKGDKLEIENWREGWGKGWEELVVGIGKGVAWDGRIVYIAGGILCVGLAILSNQSMMKNHKIIFHEHRNSFSSTENVIGS